MRHILTLFDISKQEIERIFAVSADLKSKYSQGLREPLLPGRTLALLFQKPSLRTRVSFETAILHLGGGSLFLGKDVGWGHRESIADFGQVLSQYVDAVVCRSNSHEDVERLAAHSHVPVINGLTDLSHPCQALADLFTLREVHSEESHPILAYVGDANNVARSLAVACGKLGLEFRVASPEGYGFDAAFVARIKAACPDLRLHQTTDPAEAVQNAHAVYTDVWVSMGQEEEREVRTKAFEKFQVDQNLMSLAAKNACFLHCLPANRGLEVTKDVIDGPQSAVIQEASNRMHVQKGLLAWLLTTKS